MKNKKLLKVKSTSIPVYVDTPNNGVVKHGEIIGTKFVRNLHGADVRWSDKSFCVNVLAMSKLMGYSVYTLQFRYRMAECLKVYEFEISDLHLCSTVKNEYGEENIRIPIEMCKLVESKDL
jgi:hypothetical protein